MNDLDRRVLLGTAGLAGIAAIASRGRAGPLSPPAGAVASTGRTLLEVEPRVPLSAATTPGNASVVFRITQPGSYYLTGNVAAAAGQNGVSIEASDVVLDLMGFEVKGTSAAGSKGVYAAITRRHIVVRNGSVVDWDRAVEFAGNGCGACGIDARTIAAGIGFSLGNTAAAADCVVTASGTGFSLADGGSLDRCHARECQTAGFQVANAVVARACSAADCAGVGFRCTGSAHLESCSALRCAQSGFDLPAPATMLHCTSTFNTQHGVSVAARGRIIDCVLEMNQGHGIAAGSRCLLRGNTCDANGGSGSGFGIAVTGARNRIEDNHCTSNDQGINVSGAQNLIVRNFVSGNAALGYSIAASNLFGPTVLLTNGGINGSNPHANYEA